MFVPNSRNLEDFVTWVDSSKIKRNIMKYSDKVFLLIATQIDFLAR